MPEVTNETESQEESKLERRQRPFRHGREVTLAAVISGSALAWPVGTSWIDFRDGIFQRIFHLESSVDSSSTRLKELSDILTKHLEKVEHSFRSIEIRLNELEIEYKVMEKRK